MGGSECEVVVALANKAADLARQGDLDESLASLQGRGTAISISRADAAKWRAFQVMIVVAPAFSALAAMSMS